MALPRGLTVTKTIFKSSSVSTWIENVGKSIFNWMVATGWSGWKPLKRTLNGYCHGIKFECDAMDVPDFLKSNFVDSINFDIRPIDLCSKQRGKLRRMKHIWVHAFVWIQKWDSHFRIFCRKKDDTRDHKRLNQMRYGIQSTSPAECCSKCVRNWAKHWSSPTLHFGGESAEEFTKNDDEIGGSSLRLASNWQCVILKRK